MKSSSTFIADLPESFSAFTAGLIKPSLTAIMTAVVAFVFSGLWFLQSAEDLVAGYPQLLASGPGDDYAFITAAALNVADTKPSRRGVAVLGASCLRAATDEVKIESELQNADISERVFNLTTRGQSLWESIAIADYIVPGFGGVLLIDTNPLRFARGLSTLETIMRNQRVGFRSPILVELALDANIPATPATGYYAWDNRIYLRARLNKVFKNLLLGPVEHEHSRLSETIDKEKRNWVIERITEDIKSYDEDVEVLLDALSKLSTALSRSDSATIILIEPPINPNFIDTVIGRDFYARHMNRIRQYARSTNIQFWEMNEELAFGKSNFADWCHLNNTHSRDEYSQLLTDNLIREFLRE